MKEIDTKLTEILTNEYDSYVKETQAKNTEHLKEYISTQAPEYSGSLSVLKY
jgi:hypothetical protein